MLRFVACIWNPQSEAQESQARRLKAALLRDTRWNAVFDEPGLSVSCSGVTSRSVECYELTAFGGVVLGKLHRRGGDPKERVTLGEDVQRSVARTGGRHLIERFWGQYVCFARGEDRGQSHCSC